MSIRNVFRRLFASGPSREELEYTKALLSQRICPACSSVNKMGERDDPSHHRQDLICHVCGKGWQTTVDGNGNILVSFSLGVVVEPYHTAYMAGDLSDKHVPVYD